MSAKILDGKQLALQIRSEIAERVQAFRQSTGIAPCLAAILVGDDAGSQVYVRNKELACAKAGMESRLFRMPGTTSTAELLELLDRLNADPMIHGILVQLPLPRQIDERLRPRYLPCTPHGVLQLLHRSGIALTGAEVVVVGRSDIVGKPLVSMCLQKLGPCGASNANATVTCCHSQTKDLGSVTRRADILIVAIGRPRAITADMVKPGAVVIDVGINREGDAIVGDVDFEAVSAIAGAITPVPGGIGPLTIAMLLENTLTAAKFAADV
ncbi:MAG: bifunctional 5,10-methylene-tetrahydrofolate dehydrogenase/5,10-methylene-tetrahydrofolate cyclohydrolase [Pirellula sp.]|nr:bifunctional 5,10-methylene-tetrahydrofolate dehydrogenase/5,10-methylene-tetrahydrofolate cyclohydrolase [Pirellula sp.]